MALIGDHARPPSGKREAVPRLCWRISAWSAAHRTLGMASHALHPPHIVLMHAQQYDALHSLPTIAPRPLLVANGAEDPRCPVEGLQPVFAATLSAYEAAGCPDKFKARLLSLVLPMDTYMWLQLRRGMQCMH